MSTLETNLIQPSTGTTLTLGASGDTVTLGSGATQTGFGGVMTPAFEAYLSSDQSITHFSTTKININTEIFDTDNCYDNSTNYRFTPTTAGKYYVYANLISYTGQIGDNLFLRTHIFKNGSEYKFNLINMNNNPGEYLPCYVDATVVMNGTTDYIEIYGTSYAVDGSGTIILGNTQVTKGVYFGAYKIIE